MLYLVVLVLLILLLVYVSKTSVLANRLEELARELTAHRGRIQELEGRLTTPPSSQPASFPPSRSAPDATPSVPIPPPAPITQQSIPPPIKAEPGPAIALPPPKPSRTREEWEALIGGKLLNRIGALALIIGIGFFLKYAFDNDWITESLRVALGGMAGFGLLLTADRTKKKGYEIFSQGLVGAGLAVLYLSVYASFNFYALIPQSVAFILMGGVTVLTFIEAFRNNALAVAILGWAGGFMTPFMLSTGEANEIGLFTYIALLDAGILAVVIMRGRWVVLHALTLAATYVVYFAWNVEFYTQNDLLVTVYCLTVFWILFHALDVVRIFKPAITWGELRELLSVANILFFYPSLYAIVNPDHQEAMAWATLVIGLVYFLTAQLVRAKGRDGEFAVSRSTLTAIVLLVIATAIQFSGFTTVACWSVEAVVLVWCGVRWKMKYVWLSAAGLLLVAGIKLMFTPEAFGYEPVFDGGVLLNQRAYTYLILAAAAWIAAFLLSDGSERLRHIVSTSLYYLSCILLFALITIEAVAYYDVQMMGVPGPDRVRLEFTQLISLGVLWMLSALVLLWVGRWKPILPVVYSSLAMLTCGVLMGGMRGIAYAPVEEFTFILNIRFGAIVAILAGMGVATVLLRSGSQLGDWIPDVVGVIQVGFVLLLLALLTGETRDIFEKELALLPQGGTSAERSRLSDLQQLSLSGVWLVYSIGLMGAGIWKRRRGLRLISIVLFGFTILKIFIYDLSFLDTLYRIFSFIGLGLILLSVSYLYQRYKGIILEHPPGTSSKPEA